MKIVIIGGGFAGMNLAKNLAGEKGIEVTLVDKNNYNYFPPLIYQVAASFIEPSAISYPFRKMFQGAGNVRFYQAAFLRVDAENNIAITDQGSLEYDCLVLANGAKTNYYGLSGISRQALPLKNIWDAIRIRNTILDCLEKACKATSRSEKEKLLTFVVAGGGPAGVEVSGMLAEMNRYIRKKDYPELRHDPIRICLVDAGNTLLSSMSSKSQQKSFASLAKLGVQIRLGTAVKDFRDNAVLLSTGETIQAKTLIWVSGVIAREVAGLPANSMAKNHRIVVNAYNQVRDTANIYAIGDICCQDTDKRFPNGHPQVAQVAIQQGQLLARNFKRMMKKKTMQPFRYRDKGSMAIISKYQAVADLPVGFFRGFIAWVLWLLVHILPIAGFRNKMKLMFSWCWNFISNDPTLRLLIHAPQHPESDSTR